MAGSIATRTGDEGTTGLLYGQRVPKDHPQIEAVGAFDELNVALGATKPLLADPAVSALVAGLQRDLVALMGELACAESDVAPPSGDARALDGAVAGAALAALLIVSSFFTGAACRGCPLGAKTASREGARRGRA